MHAYLNMDRHSTPLRFNTYSTYIIKIIEQIYTQPLIHTYKNVKSTVTHMHKDMQTETIGIHCTP